MMQDTLRQRELEVEEARARFADDLAVLRSPGIFAAFTDDLKQEAMATKDRLVEEARGAVGSKVTGVVEDIKAKAAANPAAALMAGAGVGWYLLRHPPITMALIGYGLFSLLRTEASVRPHAQTRDLVHQGQERLKQQANELASHVASKGSAMAHAAGAAIADRSGELFDAAQDHATRLTQDAADKVSDGATAVQERVSGLISRAGGMTADVSDRAGQVTQRVSAQAARSLDAAERALPNGDARDRVLLGVAGLAVAAALGIAWQRRSSENAGASSAPSRTSSPAAIGSRGKKTRTTARKRKTA
jgi:hypothetical protein